MKLVHWPLMGGLLHLVQRGGAWMGRSPPRPLPLLAVPVPNVTAQPSTASVPVTVLLYNGALLCGFNVSVKGLTVIPGHRTTHVIHAIQHPLHPAHYSIVNWIKIQRTQVRRNELRSFAQQTLICRTLANILS